MALDEPLWPGRSGRDLTTGPFYGRVQRYLELAGLPRWRPRIPAHRATLRRDAGEAVSRFLDHSALAVTSL